MTELIAAEKTRTQTRRKIGAIAARTHKAMQPALGPMRRNLRIGVSAQHRLLRTLLIDYSRRIRRDGTSFSFVRHYELLCRFEFRIQATLIVV